MVADRDGQARAGRAGNRTDEAIGRGADAAGGERDAGGAPAVREGTISIDYSESPVFLRWDARPPAK